MRQDFAALVSREGTAVVHQAHESPETLTIPRTSQAIEVDQHGGEGAERRLGRDFQDTHRKA